MRHYRFIDGLTLAYMALVGMLILLFHGDRVPLWRFLILARIGVAVAVHLLIQAHAAGRGGRGVAFLRDFYPILLYTAFYRETGLLNQMFATGYLDATLIVWDQALFGFDPALRFMEAYPQAWVREFFYAAYFSYYVMIAGLALALLNNRERFHHYVAVVSLAFYACYLTYIFVPVIGPRIYHMPEVALLPVELQPNPPLEEDAPPATGLFPRLVLGIYRVFESPGAAFPSSHVVIAIATLFMSWRFFPRWRLPHLFAVVALCVSTVYCRYHYVGDVLAGIVTAVVLVPAANRIYALVSRRRERIRDPGEEGYSPETPS